MEGKKGWLIWEEERVIEGYKFIKSPPAHGVKVEQGREREGGGGGEREREREGERASEREREIREANANLGKEI